MCSNQDLLNALYVIKIVIRAISIIVPIVLIVSLSIKIAKSIANDGFDNEVKKKCITSAIAAVIVFMVPTFVDLFANLMNVEYRSCWDAATSMNARPIGIGLQSGSGVTPSPSPGPSPTPTPQTGVEGTYGRFKTYTNPKNGLTFNLYYQGDSEWGNKSLNGNTVGESGCNMISSAVISSGYDSSITPLTAYNKRHGNSFPYTAVNDLTNGAFNCYQLSSPSTRKQDIIDALKAGKVVAIMAYGPNNGGSNPLVLGGQHYMALIDISGDGTQIYVGNSHSSQTNYSASGWFNTNEVLTSLKEVNICEVK